MLMMDGGNIELVDVKDDEVQVRLSRRLRHVSKFNYDNEDGC
jgi:hypothetical protein